jgi:VanZ family protein
MQRYLLYFIAWTWAGIVVSATLSRVTVVHQIYNQLTPWVSRPRRKSFQHGAQLIAFAMMGALMSCCYEKRTILVTCALVFGAAITEFLQTLTPDRHAQFADAAWKMAGGIIGVALVKAATLFGS